METVEVSLEVILNHPSGRYEAHLGRHGFSGQSGKIKLLQANTLISPII